MRVVKRPIVAFVVTSFICSTPDETFVAAELNNAVLKVDLGDSPCLLELGAAPPVWVTSTKRLPFGSAGADAAREVEAIFSGSGLVTEAATG